MKELKKNEYTKKYMNPQMEIVDLNGENTIGTSGGGCGAGDLDGMTI